MQIDEKDFLSFITVKQNLAPETIRHCMSRFRIIKAWFAGKELTKENVEKFFLELKQNGLRNNSLNTYNFAFRHFRDYCKDRGLPSDFFDGFKSFKKNRADIVVFTPEEIEKILNITLNYGNFRGRDVSILNFRYVTMTMFLAYTGCRYSEAANLKIKHLDLSACKATFTETKTNQNRTVYFTEPLIGNLKKMTEGWSQDAYVFRNAVENQIKVSDYSADLKRRARAAGVTKRTFPHNFRHSFITTLLEIGVPIEQVALLVGHRDIRTTFSTYAHLADKTLQRAAMRHPLMQKNVNPHEIVKLIKETLENFHLENDSRFKFDISVRENGLMFSLQAKNQ
ncbi:MAG: hypothetical protein UT84_C0022G0003 [Candidatus Curtissbacteria bacterium GW2011_GWA1_40_16]|uniref:Uncharacterized protein n=1 Tax=Candidatus Curtissbacteria bacterium GW2011_GWA1_40_16 TaxID=1618405 RepID=A0A0G0TRH7_9BACT|nr:MAG: hypothetical protein UT84_C0022G0003 [Candidatus Curtissbacteria bacterium GW2011_GWA1_40_16]